MFWDTQLKDRKTLKVLAEKTPGVDDDDGVFIMCTAVEKPGTHLERCDAFSWGPKGPMRDGDQRQNSLFGTEVITSTKQLVGYDIVFAVPPIGYIIYTGICTPDLDRLHDVESEKWLVENYDPPCATRTLHEMFRLMWEWTQVTYEPFSNDEVAAVTAAGILDRLKTDQGLTDEILNEVVAVVPPMQIARYLAGDADARNRPTTSAIPPAPQLFLNWLESTCEPIPNESAE